MDKKFGGWQSLIIFIFILTKTKKSSQVQPVDEEISGAVVIGVEELDLGFGRVLTVADELSDGVGAAEDRSLRAQGQRQRVHLKGQQTVKI